MVLQPNPGAAVLLLSIARCPVVAACRQAADATAGSAGCGPCATIVGRQSSVPDTEHHLPEPWSGDLETAPILFISSNPSISRAEQFPTPEWPDEQIVDFFTHRFGGGQQAWTDASGGALRRRGGYRAGGSTFWRETRGLAAELLNCPAEAVRSGQDYALTEVVHCKSRLAMGVREAADACAERYLTKVLAVAQARVLVVLGSKARPVVLKELGLPPRAVVTGQVIGPMTIGDRPRLMTFLPHPAASSARSLADHVAADDLAALRQAAAAPITDNGRIVAP